RPLIDGETTTGRSTFNRSSSTRSQVRCEPWVGDDFPKPGRSTAYARYPAPARALIVPICFQVSALKLAPCRRTTGRPRSSPSARYWTSPPPPSPHRDWLSVIAPAPEDCPPRRRRPSAPPPIVAALAPCVKPAVSSPDRTGPSKPPTISAPRQGLHCGPTSGV